LADPEAIADELNPLTISYTANTISCTAIGKVKNNEIADVGLWPNIPNKPDANNKMPPTKPQTDILIEPISSKMY
jgi:hypothetical protein